MILSSRPSRQTRAQSNLISAISSHNKEAKQYQAPQINGLRKSATLQRSNHQGQLKPIVNDTPVKSLTLNRLDLQRVKDRQNQANRINSPSPVLQPPPPPPPLPSNRPQVKSNTLRPTRHLIQKPNGYGPKTKAESIYAPASIASPREFAHNLKSNGVNLASHCDSNHYATTSVRGMTPSESGRSGRESALGYIFERLGTLGRRSKWRRSLKKTQVSPTLKPLEKLPDIRTISSPIPEQTALDPEIYAANKREVKAEDIYAEGSWAMDGNYLRRLVEHEIDVNLMNEGETRTLIDEESERSAEYIELISSLTNWINDELAQQRIIVTDLQADLYDGQILSKLIEKLHQIKLDIIEVTQNESLQKEKLRLVLGTINRILTVQAKWAKIRWTIEGIHSKNMVEIISLLVTLAQFYKAPLKLPNNLKVRILVVQKYQDRLMSRISEVQLMDSKVHQNFQLPMQKQRDAFDTLIEFAPEKLVIVKQSLVNFANRHLNKINMNCYAQESNQILDPEQFSDGLLLVFLISSLEEYFVPLGNLFTAAVPQYTLKKVGTMMRIDQNNNTDVDHYTIAQDDFQTALKPDSYINTQPIHKLHNVNMALLLIEDAGVEIRNKVRAEDIVNGDLKSVLRVLYALFSRYRHL